VLATICLIIAPTVLYKDRCQYYGALYSYFITLLIYLLTFIAISELGLLHTRWKIWLCQSEMDSVPDEICYTGHFQLWTISH